MNKSKVIRLMAIVVFLSVFTVFHAFAYEKQLSTKADNITDAIDQPQSSIENTGSSKTDGLIVIYNKDIRPIKLYNKLKSTKSCEIEELMPGISLVRFSTKKLYNAQLSEILNDPSVISIEPDMKRYLSDAPNDEYFTRQWAMQNIEACEAWSRISSIKKSTLVSVIDSGVNPNHPDLSNRLFEGKGFKDGMIVSDTSDVIGHGTAVTGIITAETDNSLGIAGVAGTQDIKAMPLKVFWDEDGANLSDIIKAIDYAIVQNVDVINMSLGSNFPSNAEEEAIKRALNAGIIVVASAGNDGTNDYTYPASYSGVLSVGAIKQNNKRAMFSNYNNRLSLVAPGYQIQSTAHDGGYGYYDGTSFSAPYVSGIAAFIKAVSPELKNNDILKILINTCDDLGAAGRDIYYGYGKVNFNNALEWILKDTAVNYPMPPGTVVLGNKAYALDYANDVINYKEIIDALINSNGVVYVKKYNGSWIDNNTGDSVQPNEIPSVEYKDTIGMVTYYKAGDGNVH